MSIKPVRRFIQPCTYSREHRGTEIQKALKHAYEEANITSAPTFVIGDMKLPDEHSKETLSNVLMRRSVNNALSSLKEWIAE